MMPEKDVCDMTLEEYDAACREPDENELNFRQWELLRKIEFVVEMRRMYGASPKES